jgi:Zn-dependent metalloprotease
MRIYYRALTVYFTSGETYPQARAHTLQAAADCMAPARPSNNGVAAAWSAVNVN